MLPILNAAGILSVGISNDTCRNLRRQQSINRLRFTFWLLRFL